MYVWRNALVVVVDDDDGGGGGGGVIVEVFSLHNTKEMHIRLLSLLSIQRDYSAALRMAGYFLLT